jgi:hypothetical protein
MDTQNTTTVPEQTLAQEQSELSKPNQPKKRKNNNKLVLFLLIIISILILAVGVLAAYIVLDSASDSETENTEATQDAGEDTQLESSQENEEDLALEDNRSNEVEDEVTDETQKDGEVLTFNSFDLTLPEEWVTVDNFDYDSDTATIENCYRIVNGSEESLDSCEVYIVRHEDDLLDSGYGYDVYISAPGIYYESTGYVPTVVAAQNVIVDGESYAVSIEYYTNENYTEDDYIEGILPTEEDRSDTPHSIRFCTDDEICFSANFMNLVDEGGNAKAQMDKIIEMLDGVVVE